MKCYMIRHGATKGNQEHRYLGRTDEGVLPQEYRKLKRLGEILEPVDYVFTSPYLRCCQSAQILFPRVIGKTETIFDFREMDFGIFEYKNYLELNGNPDYQRYLDSGGKTAFPGGEQPEQFKRRCCQAFLKCIEKARLHHWQSLGFVLHGGTIMAVMEAWGKPRREYFDYQVKNGCGYEIEARLGQELSLSVLRKLGDLSAYEL